MRSTRRFLIGVFGVLILSAAALGDMVVITDGRLIDGKITASNDKEVVIQPDVDAKVALLHIERGMITDVIYTDEHGAVVPAPAEGGKAPATRPAPQWDIPKEPAAPPLVAVAPPSYYLVPLHGEVGATVLANILDKSLADAVLRKPTVVVLDIDSPGGSVKEAEQIVQILHHYNKKLRLVALTNQDLSAAAIFSLAIKEIYVKPTSTIGAATLAGEDPRTPSAKVDEKMQSAWRALARNSAEEGGHEPLLAEAMIDNTMELHLEKVAGKPVVKEGPGNTTLCHKGQVLTLTSHEAVASGLAAGEAEDLATLGQALGFAKWKECKGLGTALADYLPTRAAALLTQMKKTIAEFNLNVRAAMDTDPTQKVTLVKQRLGPPVPGMPDKAISTAVDTGKWKQRSLACVVVLQKVEQNLRDARTLYDALGRSSEGSLTADALAKFSAWRAQTYDDRNKYGAGKIIVVRPPDALTAHPVTRPDKPTAVGEKTAMVGGSGGSPFVNVKEDKTTVIGFKISLCDLAGRSGIQQIEPVYDVPAKLTLNDLVISVNKPGYEMARTGYVVGGVIVKKGNGVIGLSIIFVKKTDKGVDSKQSYQSDWYGCTDGAEGTKLAGNGERVIGIFGRQGANTDALGLVLDAPDGAATTRPAEVARAATKRDYAAFRVTAAKYKDTDDLDAAVLKEFGPDYRVADWNDITPFENQAAAWADGVGFHAGAGNQLFVTFNAMRATVNHRQYYIERCDGNKPAGFGADATLDRDTICLGSWKAVNYSILAVKK